MKKLFLLSAVIILFSFPGCDFSFSGDGVISPGCSKGLDRTLLRGTDNDWFKFIAS